MNSILKVEKLTYKNILKNINFELENNTFNILLGSNGSGKTTLIKCICNLLDYSGNITFKNDKILSNIGVLTDSSLLLDGTVQYNITYPLLNLNYDELEAKKIVFTLSKKLEINDLLTKNVLTLTSSERKLVLFATIVVANPKLIIIDDTLDDLDNYYKEKLIKYLKKMKATILFVTNNEEDFKLCDNIILLDKGEIIFNDRLSEVLKQEKLLQKVKSKLPFENDLLNKLKFYNLIDNEISSSEGLIDLLWK